MDPVQISKLRAILESKGVEFQQPAYSLFQARFNSVTCTAYPSGKVVIQGKGMDDFIRYTVEPEVLGTFTYGVVDETPRIGVDESGKGDFFGPLCIAAVFASQGQVQQLIDWGVRDSKKIGDEEILTLSKKIIDQYAHEVIRIYPERYNTLYESFKNLNSLLAWGHATAIDTLLDRVSCTHVIIDQFAHPQVVLRALKKKQRAVDVHQRTKAEADPVVAAASILARAAFLQGLQMLSKEAGFPLPKGAGDPVLQAGKRWVTTWGVEQLHRVAKLHFKTKQDILDL